MNVGKNILNILFVFFLSIPSFCFADTFIFQKNLSIGTNSPDVLKLQQILNSDPETKIADAGIGSSGKETSYFGNLTRLAVIKFQNKYEKDILSPAGLSFGTGFVGSLTRNKLNGFILPAGNVSENTQENNDFFNVASSSNVSVGDNSILLNNVSSGVVSPEALFPAVKPTDVILTSLSNAFIAPGDVLTVKGKGFLSQNVLHIGNSYSVSFSEQNGNFSLKTPVLAKGLYEVWVENANGSSRDISSQYINISDSSLSRPILTSSYPLNVSTNSKVTLVGTNFDPSNNTINSNLGTLRGIPSSNGKITFSISDFPDAKKVHDKDLSNGLVVTYSVSNSYGQSANFGRFSFSSTVADSSKNIFTSTFSFLKKAAEKFFGITPAFAQSARTFDGGTIQVIVRQCYCSGGTEIKFKSYVDSGTYTYLYEPGATQLYENYDVYSSGNYFLDTHFPGGVCQYGAYCAQSDVPDGTLTQIGTS